MSDSDKPILPKLSIARPGQALEEFELSKSPVLVGRVKSTDILVLGDPAISREHCCFEIEPESGALTVRDMGSSNGTFLNGHPVGVVAEAVKPGDKIQVGGTVMTFSVDRPSQGAIVRTIKQKFYSAPLPPQPGEKERTFFGDGFCTCGRCGGTLTTKNHQPGEKVGCPRCRAVWQLPAAKPDS